MEDLGAVSVPGAGHTYQLFQESLVVLQAMADECFGSGHQSRSMVVSVGAFNQGFAEGGAPAGLYCFMVGDTTLES